MDIQIGNKSVGIESLNGDLLFSILNGRETKEERLADLRNAIDALKEAQREKYSDQHKFFLMPNPASSHYEVVDFLSRYLQKDKESGELFYIYQQRKKQEKHYLTPEEKQLIALQLLIISLDQSLDSGIPHDGVPLLSELAYRTALKIQKSTHLGNNNRYPILLQKIKNHADTRDFSGFKPIAGLGELVLGIFTFVIGLGLAPFTGGVVAVAGGALSVEGWRNLQQTKQPSAKEQYQKINRLREETFLPALTADNEQPGQPNPHVFPAPLEVKTQITRENIVLLDDVLFYVLNGRETEEEKVTDFRDAVALLKQVITERELQGNEALKALVKSLDAAIISDMSPHDFPLLAAATYRTALQLDNRHQYKGNNYENLFTLRGKIDIHANNTKDARSDRYNRVVFALEAALGFCIFVGGIGLTCSGLLPGIAVMAAGAALFAEGMRNFGRVDRQVEGTERY